MKFKEEVNLNGKAAFYAVLYNSMKEKALDLGYALALHGSMQSDMDMIAVAWVNDAKPVSELIEAMNSCIGRTVWEKHNIKTGSMKPHGNLCYTLSILGDWYIDITVAPPLSKLDNEWIVFDENSELTFPPEGETVLINDGDNSYDTAWYLLSSEYVWMKNNINDDTSYVFTEFIPKRWKYIK